MTRFPEQVSHEDSFKETEGVCQKASGGKEETEWRVWSPGGEVLKVEKELFMKAPQVLSQASNEFFFKALMQKAAPYYTMQLHRCRKKHLYCLSHFSVFFLLFNT